ncbi:MAG: carbohydrate porin [Prolixibacteraceae bacterium]
MNDLRRGLVLLGLLIAINGWSQLPDENENSGWQLGASYKGDLVSNVNGGITTGTNYLGLADLYIAHSGLWKGAEFLVHGANSHGGEPSANLIGDFQVVSNIEAGNHTFLYELWYKQTIQSLRMTIGLQDLNAEFASSDVAAIFLNSSFGIHSVISDNITAPIFPLTSPGITICQNLAEHWCLKTAFYKGCPIDFEGNPYNVKWNLNHLQGLLWVSESQLKWSGPNESQSALKSGVFFHQHCPESEVVNTETGNTLSFDYGVYLVGDHQWEIGNDLNHQLNIFYQFGISPRNDNIGYFGAGCTYTGIFSKIGADELGLAMAWGMLTPERGRDELTFELTYMVPVAEHIYLQPDIQYVVNPGATGTLLKNATVGLLRLGMEF